MVKGTSGMLRYFLDFCLLLVVVSENLCFFAASRRAPMCSVQDNFVLHNYLEFANALRTNCIPSVEIIPGPQILTPC